MCAQPCLICCNLMWSKLQQHHFVFDFVWPTCLCVAFSFSCTVSLAFDETNNAIPPHGFSAFPLSWRWATIRSHRPSPWVFSSPPSSLPLLPRNHSTACPSRSCGTSSSASRTLRTSALLSAVFTNVSLSSRSHSKVGGDHHFVC